jgi:hypothetical protein
MVSPNAATQVRFCPHVVWKVVDDTLALLEVNSGEYFSVGEIGVVFAELSAQGARLGEIAARVAEEYEVSPEEALADLLELVGTLEQAGLVEAVEGEK